VRPIITSPSRITSSRYARILHCFSRVGKNLTISTLHQPITDASKPEKIWTIPALNDYLDFPHVGQAFVIERESIEKKTGEHSHEVVCEVTSYKSEKANAEKVIKTTREHSSTENSCHYVIDWNYNEDRCRIRAGHGLKNISRLRRFFVGLIKSKGAVCVAQKILELVQNTRLVFDYLKTKNTCAAHC
jgi:hypothetical protein